jgi:hypothetical protein
MQPTLPKRTEVSRETLIRLFGLLAQNRTRDLAKTRQELQALHHGVRCHISDYER